MRVGVLCSECGDYRTPCRCDMIPKEELYKLVEGWRGDAENYVNYLSDRIAISNCADDLEKLIGGE